MAKTDKDFPRPAAKIDVFYTLFRTRYGIRDGEALSFEQWKTFAQEWAAERAVELFNVTRGAYWLCEALLACREGVTDDLIREIRDAAAKQVNRG